MTQSLFQECLQRIQSGASLEDVLASHPQEADQLRPLLIAARLAQEAGKDILPSTAAQSRSLGRFLSAAQQARQNASRKPGGFLSPFAFRLAILVFVLLIATASAVAVSAQALPGQPLYTVKLATENTRLMLATNPRQRLELEQSFDSERAGEVEELIHLSRSIPVNFTGSVTKMGTQAWVISGITVLLSAGASITPGIEEGYQVIVSGLIQQDGNVSASQIRPKSFQFSGALNEMSASQLLVDGIRVRIGLQTLIDGDPVVGSRIWVSGFLLADGSIQAVQVKASGAPPAQPTDLEDTAQPTQPGPSESSDNSDDGNPDKHGPRPTAKPPTSPAPGSSDTPLPPVGPSPDPTHGHDDDDDHSSATPRPPERHATRTPTPQTPAATEVHATNTPTKRPVKTNTPKPEWPSQTWSPSPTPQQDATPRPTQDD
jgi:hypothetical protein